MRASTWRWLAAVSVVTAWGGCDSGAVDRPADAYPGPCRVELDLEVDGRPEYVSTYDYDDRGRVLVHAWDRGGDEVIDERRMRTYRGDVHVMTEIDEQDDGTIDWVQRITYDEHGRVLFDEIDDDGDGQIEGRTSRTWDEAGRLVSLVIDNPLGGLLEYQESHRHEPGREIVERQLDGDDAVDSRTVRLLDAGGLVHRDEWDYEADGAIDDVYDRRYDAAGRLVEIALDFGADRRVDELRSFVYGETGELVRWENDSDADGVADLRTSSRFDPRGNRLSDDEDAAADGVIDDRTTYSYGCFLW
jgi:hypothetical protein